MSEEEEEGQGASRIEFIGLQAFYLQFPDPYKHKLITVELGIPAEFTLMCRKNVL